MSTCSASSLRFSARLGALALLLAVAAAGATGLPRAAAAKATPGVVVTGARSGDRISIGPGGVVIEETDSTSDSTRRGATVRIDGDGWTRDVNIEVDDGGSGLVRMWSDIRVDADEVVDGDVVAIFGSIEVEGHVTGEVVSVFGSVRLLDGAVVDGDVVSVGGALDQADGATTNGQTVSVGLLPVTWGVPALSLLLGIIGALWVSSLFVGWLFAVLFPGRFVRAAATASRRTGLSLVIGIISGPVMLVAVVLLFVTVIGIPLGLVLPIAYVLLKVAGYAVASYLLGCKLLRRRVGEGGIPGPMAAGITFVTAFFVIAAIFVATTGLSRAGALFFGLLGGMVAFGLTVIGIGAVLVSRFGREPVDLRYGEAEGALPAPPPPVPPAPAMPSPLAPPGS